MRSQHERERYAARAGDRGRADVLDIGAGHLFVSAVILPILIVLAGAGWLVWQAGRVAQADALARQSERVVDQANRVQELLLDQERGVDGFLITGETSFLAPSERAHPHEALDVLEQDVAGDETQLAVVRAVRDEYLAWEDAVVRAIAAPAEGRELARMTRREARMNRMQALIDDFMRLQNDKRDANYARLAREMRVAEASAIVLLAVLGGGAALFSRRQIRVIVASVAVERAALRAKDELVATLSHELRTPLTAVLGWARLARQQRLTGEALERALATIERNAETEAQLIDDVLDTARITGGKLKLAAALVDPGAAAREAAEVVRLSAEARGVALEVSVAPDTPEVIGDAPRLQQIVWNLLSNAVKFTPRGGRVRLSVGPSGSKVLIRVADEGAGIPRDQLPRVFDRFFQADGSATRRHGGLGLGLAIVKELVALHGGEVHAESEGPGRGAVFTVTLPIAAVRAASAAPVAEAQPPAAAPAPIHGVRVLVVDDDPGTRELIAAVLDAHGAAVRTAPSALDALAALAQGGADVLVSDVSMPDTSGCDLVGKLRRSSRWGRLPALALSAYSGADDVERALGAGFQAHLAKPVSPERLVDAVARLVGRARPLAAKG